MTPTAAPRPSPAPRRREADDRREELLDAARRIALRDGLDAVGAVDVAAEAGASKALVFHYFGSVVTLRREVAATAIAALDAALASAAPGTDGTTPTAESLTAERAAVVHRIVDTVAADRRVWVDIWAGALRGDDATDTLLDGVRDRLFRRVAQRVGGVDPDAPLPPRLELLAAGWVAFAETVISRWLAGPSSDRAAVESLVLASLDALLVGAAAPSGGPADTTDTTGESAPGSTRPH